MRFCTGDLLQNWNLKRLVENFKKINPAEIEVSPPPPVAPGFLFYTHIHQLYSMYVFCTSFFPTLLFYASCLIQFTSIGSYPLPWPEEPLFIFEQVVIPTSRRSEAVFINFSLTPEGPCASLRVVICPSLQRRVLHSEDCQRIVLIFMVSSVWRGDLKKNTPRRERRGSEIAHPKWQFGQQSHGLPGQNPPLQDEMHHISILIINA